MSSLISRRATLLALGMGLAGCATSPMKRLATGQQPARFQTAISHKVDLAYLRYLPKDYSTSGGGKRWPLLIFLHGAGERGTDLGKLAVHGPPKLIKAGKEFPCIVVSPQCPADQVWDIEALDAWLSELLGTLAVDPKRVYLTGLSMGGYASWDWLATHPERFAAVVPICGGGTTIRLKLAQGARREELKRLPIWVFHGAKDNVVALDESQRMVEALKAIGNPARLTVYPDAGHDSWTAAYNDPALYEWIFGQSLK